MKRTVCRPAALVLMISELHEGLCKIRNPEPGTPFFSLLTLCQFSFMYLQKQEGERNKHHFIVFSLISNKSYFRKGPV